jgi:CHAD domain-containing protein
MTLAEYAVQTIVELMDKVQKESVAAAKDASEERIHDLRVSIRRLSETLRVFEDVCPDDSAAAIRKDLKQAMRLAGRIRNHDVAAELAKKSKVTVSASSDEERAQAVRELGEVLTKWNKGVIYKIWRTELHAKKAGKRA